MKYKNGFGAIVAIIAVVVVALVAGAIWYYTSQQNSLANSSTNLPPPNPPCCKNDAGLPPTSSVQNSSSSTIGGSNPLSSSSTYFVTPSSVPAGGMILEHGGYYSVCSGSDIPADECTEDRFNETAIVPINQWADTNTNLSSFNDSQTEIAYQVPTTTIPGNYQLENVNGLGKGSTYPLGQFTVTAANPQTNPVIDSISRNQLPSVHLRA
jgi:hypothetical protein